MPAATTAPLSSRRRVTPMRSAACLDLGRSRDEQRGVAVYFAAANRVGNGGHLDQRQMRRGEDGDIDLVAGRAIGGDKGVEVGATYRMAGETPAVPMIRVGSDTGNVEKRRRAVTRHRGAEIDRKSTR